MNPKKIYAACKLPPEWDLLADSYFQKKEFLEFCEKYNPCNQRYYLFFENKELTAGAVIYTLRIDLFTFSQIKSPIKMSVIGIPVSVSASGLTGEPGAIEKLIQKVVQEERGLILGVNLNTEIDCTPGVSMPILPNPEMALKFDSWDDYLKKLRSPYRRRAGKITSKFDGVSETRTSCGAFSKEHYRLYLEIMKRTPNKLEIIPEAFFKHLPNRFKLVTFCDKGKMICWHITCRDKARFYFFLGGNNYRLLEKYDGYFNNLFHVLKEAITQECTYLDLGQTAEIPKMRLGATPVPKQMFLYHRFGAVRWVLKKLKYFIGYRAVFPEVNVFKKHLVTVEKI